MLAFFLFSCTADKDSSTLNESGETGINNESTPVDDSNPPDDSDPGESDSPTDPPPGDIAIMGAWADNWGGLHDITNDAWVNGESTYAISMYDNDHGLVIAQNDAANPYNPGLWSRFDWTYDGDALYYCQTAYDAASEGEAMSAQPADNTNLETGCGGFSWSRLYVRLDIRGEWDDSWGTHHSISEWSWLMSSEWGNGEYQVTQYDNLGQWIVAQNSPDDPWNPDLWSRFDWAYDGNQLYYCQTAYNAATEEDALNTPASDSSDLAGGCGGFSWTELLP
jgi:hypothetical protein